MLQLKNFLKNFVSYNLWNFFISNYQYFKFLIRKKYSARGDIDKKLIEIINKKKAFIWKLVPLMVLRSPYR